MHKRQPTWLGWVAFFALLFGGLAAYMISLQEANPEAPQQMVLVLAVSVAIAGICLICLTADWWMRH